MEINKKIIIYLLVFLFSGCKQKNDTVVTKSKFDSKIAEVKYFSNDQLDSSFVFFDGKKLEEVYYYPTGKIWKYLFYSIGGKRCYYREYNMDGTLEMYEGEPCFYGRSNNDNDTIGFTSRDTITTYFFAPTIPDCSTKFFVVIEDSLYPYVYKMKDIGLWELCFTMSFKDSISKYSITKDKCVRFIVEEDTLQ
jgi:hypothetical protein